MTGRQLESVLVTRWLKTFHRTNLQWKRVRLGQAADNEDAKFYKVILRWADAIFIEDNVVYIVEGKLRPNLGAIGQLEGYGKLFRVTPEFKDYWRHTIKLILLTPVLDLNIVELCKGKGILYEHWIPEGWS